MSDLIFVDLYVDKRMDDLKAPQGFHAECRIRKIAPRNWYLENRF